MTASGEVIPVDSTSLFPVESFNVYLENSGSMNGYVNGNTGFEQSIYYYLSQVEGNGVANVMNLCYINSKVIPLGNDVETFIHHVEPVDFVKKGGNLKNSDIAVLLDTVMSRHRANEISLFVSDCIFSPSKRMQDFEVPNYLTEQSTRIERIFRDKLREMNGELAVIVCLLESNYNGYYFNRDNVKKWVEGKRPFYFWLIGSPAQLRHLLDTVPFESLRGKGAEVENLYTAYKGEACKYSVVNTGKIGRFERDRKNAQRSLLKCRPEHKGRYQGVFQFAVGVDYAALPMDDGWLTDPQNYEVTPKDYEISIASRRIGGYTHLIYLKTERTPVPATEVEVVLKNRLPGWVDERNDEVGLDLEKDEAFNKTFGLKAMMEGVHNAFGGDAVEHAKIKVSINKN